MGCAAHAAVLQSAPNLMTQPLAKTLVGGKIRSPLAASWPQEPQPGRSVSPRLARQRMI